MIVATTKRDSSHSNTPSLGDHLAVLLLLCISGNPVFLAGNRNELILLSAAGVLTLGLLARRRVFVSPTALSVTLGFLAILLIQAMAFGFLPMVTVAGFMVKLYVAFATVILVRDFPRTFVNVVATLALVSLVVFLADNAIGLVGGSLRNMIPIPPLAEFPQEPHFLVHNFAHSVGSLPYRNPGMFWEPGAFAGYLLLGLVFLASVRHRMARRATTLRLVVLTVAALTTFSTMAYVVLPLALLLQLGPTDTVAHPRITRRTVRAFATVVLIGAASLGIWKLSFVGRKMSHHYSAAVTKSEGWELNRFGSLLFDWEYIRRRPLLGWGLHRTTRYALHEGQVDASMGQGNGLSDFTAKFGFIGLFVFLAATWRGLGALTGLSPAQRAAALLAILLVLNGENFLNLPMFLALMFLREGSDPLAKRTFLFRPHPARIRLRTVTVEPQR